jgi:hypothetical protein
MSMPKRTNDKQEIIEMLYKIKTLPGGGWQHFGVNPSTVRTALVAGGVAMRDTLDGRNELSKIYADCRSNV